MNENITFEQSQANEIKQKKQQITYITRWIKDLKTTTKPQTKGRLHRINHQYENTTHNPGYCCLGILCEVGKRARKIITKTRICSNDEWFSVKGAIEEQEWQNATLGASLRDLFGIRYDEQTDLIRMNDQDGLIFSQIAQHVEENILPRLQKELEQLNAAKS